MNGGRVLRNAVAGQRRDVGLGALLGMGHQAGEALVPVLIGVIIDQAVADGGGGDAADLLRWLAVLAVVYLALSFSFRYGARAAERAAERAAHALRLELVGRVLHPRGGAEEGRLPGALTSTATEDARRVGAVNLAIGLGVAALTGLLAGAAMLLRISPTLGLLVLLGTAALLYLGHLLGKPLERRSATEQERAAHASGVAADLVSGLRVLKGIGAVPAAITRYRHTSRASLDATLRAARAEAWQRGMTTGLTGVFIAVLALLGGRLAMSGDISLGELVSAVGLALFLLGPLETLSYVNAELAQGRASAARIAEVLAAPGAPAPGTDAAAGPRLSGIGLAAVPGEVLGIAVTDSAYAARLLRGLARDAEAAPDAGVLVAAHDADLFAGTVLENVAAGAADGADLTPALAAAAVDDPHAPVGERGRFLSGGQRQRAALARALAADPPTLVLHDPTTAVDAVTEARIAAGLREARRGRTTILVTTSPTLLSAADRVALIDGGRIVDTAPHAELAERHAAYREAVLT
ncbi:ABC transporter transmembrane domain-containing protein [Streptomyces sp. 6N223]|uniref:ABC transporter transmembrane domain-containing protein n=1 Tax=Streptomyces sp. 6N223 TaxID=3457412 RepID=UPI003FD6561A